MGGRREPESEQRGSSFLTVMLAYPAVGEEEPMAFTKGGGQGGQQPSWRPFRMGSVGHRKPPGDRTAHILFLGVASSLRIARWENASFGLGLAAGRQDTLSKLLYCSESVCFKEN